MMGIALISASILLSLTLILLIVNASQTSTTPAPAITPAPDPAPAPAPSVTTSTSVVNPSATNDSSGGYSVGDHWVNTTDNSTWVAADVSVGAAVWKRASAKVNTDTTDPIATNDSSQGYAVGDQWINTSAGTTWVATGVSAGAAAWHRTNSAAANVAAVNPGTTNDSSEGYVVGDIWVNTSSGGSTWVATNVSPGAAAWRRVGTKVRTGSGDPGFSTDSSIGYAIGDIYLNLVTNGTFAAISVSPGSAVWIRLGVTAQTAAGIPGPGDDSIQGYAVGDQFVSTGAADSCTFVATDVTALNAVWRRTSARRSTVNPGPTNDSTSGNMHQVGDYWINTTDNSTWVAVDVTPLNAVWRRTTPTISAVSPGAGNDSTFAGGGYHVGDKWVNTTDDSIWVAVDVTATAAIWKRTTSVTAATDPTAADGSSLGYQVGDQWVNEATDSTWIAVDVTAPASAIWRRTDTINSYFYMDVCQGIVTSAAPPPPPPYAAWTHLINPAAGFQKLTFFSGSDPAPASRNVTVGSTAVGGVSEFTVTNFDAPGTGSMEDLNVTYNGLLTKTFRVSITYEAIVSGQQTATPPADPAVVPAVIAISLLTNGLAGPVQTFIIDSEPVRHSIDYIALATIANGDVLSIGLNIQGQNSGKELYIRTLRMMFLIEEYSAPAITASY